MTSPRILELAEALLREIHAQGARGSHPLDGQPCRLCGRTQAPALRNGAPVLTKAIDVGGSKIPLCLACEHSSYVTKTMLSGKAGDAEWLAKRLITLSRPYDPKRPYGTPKPKRTRATSTLKRGT